MSWSLAASCAAANEDTRTLPSFVPSVAENQEIRSWGPAKVVRTANTLELSAIAIGIPCTFGWPSTSPVVASTMGSEALVVAEGRLPWTIVAGMYAMRPLDEASWSAGSAPGSGVTLFFVTSRIPPSAIFCLHEPVPPMQPSGSTYSTSSHEYASVRPAPATPPSHWPVPSLVWWRLPTVRSGPPYEAARTSSTG